MNTKEIEELEQLAAGATPGPWEATLSYPYYVSVPVDKGSGLHEKVIDEAFDPADAAFIAVARQAVPELIAEIKKLQKKYDYLLTYGTEAPVSGICLDCGGRTSRAHALSGCATCRELATMEGSQSNG